MPAHQQFKSWYLFLITLASKTPFLFAGYGREEDAWSQALNAKLISESGVYEVSRLPGHPIYELLLAFLWPLNHQYWFYNGLSALATALCVVLFYHILQNLKINNAFWLSLTFGFIPVFFTAGTYTIDYNLALLFILSSWLSLQKGNVWYAGVALGVATGFRISSIAFIIPICLATGTKNRNTLFRYFLSAGGVAIISFLPPLQRYGISFLDFHKPPFPGWASIGYKLTIGVWGFPLLVAIAILKGKWLSQGVLNFFKRREASFRQLGLAAITAWLLCLLVFARLPFKAEFFIPSLPFLMVLVGFLGSTKQLKLLFIASLISTFSFGFDYANPFRGATPSPLAIKFKSGTTKLFFDPLQGPALIDLHKRQNKSHLVEQTLAWAAEQRDSCLLIAGWYWPELELKADNNLKVKFDYYSTADEVLSYHNQSYSVFYLPEINEANQLINAHYRADSLGQELDPL